jgi:hypothetical protein
MASSLIARHFRTSADSMSARLWLVAWLVMISGLASALIPFGDSNLRISGFDPVFVALCAAAPLQLRLKWSHWYTWMAMLAGVIVLHTFLISLVSDQLGVTALIKNVLKFIYAFTAIGLLSAYMTRYIQPARQAPYQIMAMAAVYIMLAYWLEAHRPDIMDWRQPASFFMTSPPVVVFSVAFFLQFWINRYYFRTRDVPAFVIAQFIYAGGIAHILRQNGLEGLYLPFYISLYLPYLHMLANHPWAQQHRRRAITAFIAFWLITSHVFIGYVNWTYKYYRPLTQSVSAYITDETALLYDRLTNAPAQAEAQPAMDRTEARIQIEASLKNMIPATAGADSRKAMWALSLISIRQHPLLGVGVGQLPDHYLEVMQAHQWRNMSSIHNSLLSLAMWFGVFALPFFVFLGYLVYKSWAALGPWEFINVYAILGAFVVPHDMFGVQGLWLFLAYIISCIIVHERTAP